MSIKFVQKGDFSKFEKYIKHSRRTIRLGEKAQALADACIEQLKIVTPKDSGLTSESWSYEINIVGKKTSITFYNSNIQNGVNVALLLEYGHATSSGSWIEGNEYIEPAIREKYLETINDTWKEMTKL